jgi:hypothetical protein
MAIRITCAEELAAVAAACRSISGGRVISHERAPERERHKITCVRDAKVLSVGEQALCTWTMLTERRWIVPDRW